MHFPAIDRHSAKPLLGLSVSYPSPGALERIGPDWDWIWIDAQHGDLDFRDTVTLVRAGHLIGRPCLVRIAAHDPGLIGKILDSGAAGIIAPMVETVGEARLLATAAKFPPMGNRSYGGRRVIDFAGRGFYHTANRDTVLILQIESSTAADAADEMAALEGVDGLFLGPDDLLIRNGLDVDTPKTTESIGVALRKVASACKRHGKLLAGIGATDAMLGLARELKYDLVVGGGDVKFLAAGSTAAAKRVREFFSPPS
jgi:4-hydroxy-2-oxoheptanedioate aldolase